MKSQKIKNNLEEEKSMIKIQLCKWLHTLMQIKLYKLVKKQLKQYITICNEYVIV